MARGRPQRPSPEELLDPRSRPSIEELFHAIHEVNPTDRGLSPSETSRRYGLKARLQSLLLKRHGHAVDVVDETDGRVLLRHRSKDRDFCHALLAELDDEARSIARRSLDVGEDDPSPAPGAPLPRVDRRPADPLREARDALEAWDLETAGALLREAHAAGRAEATAMLVELLVDTLADDAAALALALREDAAPAVRARVAVAAARSGQAGLAMRLLADVGAAEAAEARVHLARAALRAGQTAGAVRLLALAREGAPALSELAAVEAEVARTRRDELGSLEKELEAATDDAAEVVARRILEIDREHPKARSVVRGRSEARRQQALQRLLAEARSAESAGLWGLAREKLGEAREHGAEVADALERIGVAQGRSRVEAAVAEALRAFGRSATEGIEAWLALDPALRSDPRFVAPELAWIPQESRATGGRALELARAAVAAGAARTALEAGRAAEARATLEGAGEAVDLLREGRALRRRVVEAVVAAERDAADRALRSAEARLEADPAGALAALEGWVAGDDDQERRRAELARRAKASLAHQQAVDEAGDPDPFVARRAARRLADQEPGGGWAERASVLTNEVQRRFRVTVRDDPDLDLRDENARIAESGGRWFTADGSIVLVTVRVHQVLVRVADPESRRVRRAIHLVTPSFLDRVIWEVRGDFLQVAGRAGFLLQLTLDGGVVGWWDLGRIVGPATRVIGTMLLPDAARCWLATQPDADVVHWSVIDLERRQVVRVLSNLVEAYVHDTTPPVVSALERGRGVRLLGLDGTARRSVRPTGGRRWVEEIAPMARAQALHPEDPDGLVVLLDPPVGDRGTGPVGWVELRPDLPRPEAHWLEGTAKERGSSIAPALEDRLAFVYAGGARTASLLALGSDGTELEEIWEVNLRAGVALVGDAGSRRAWLVYTRSDGLGLERLGPDSPALEHLLEDPARFVPRFGLQDCTGLAGDAELEQAVTQVHQLIGRTADNERVSLLERMIAEAPTGEDLAPLALALAYTADAALWELSARAAARFPEDGTLALMAAQQDGRAGRWDEAVRRLAPVDPESLAEGRRAHFFHVAGLAAWHSGDRAGATAIWARGGDAPCPCRRLADAAEASVGALQEPRTVVGRLCRAIVEADELLAAGDPRGAVAALDAPDLWALRERQAAARRAAAWLQIEPRGPDEQLRRLVGTTFLRHAIEVFTDLDGGDLPVPDAWSEERVIEVSWAVARSLGEPDDWSVQVRP